MLRYNTYRLIKQPQPNKEVKKMSNVNESNFNNIATGYLIAALSYTSLPEEIKQEILKKLKKFTWKIDFTPQNWEKGRSVVRMHLTKNIKEERIKMNDKIKKQLWKKITYGGELYALYRKNTNKTIGLSNWLDLIGMNDKNYNNSTLAEVKQFNINAKLLIKKAMENNTKETGICYA
jgi:hypothetical protein